MTCKFEAGKEYRTRDGRRARVYATDGGGEYPVHGAIFDPDVAWWRQESWSMNGNFRHCISDHAYDLMSSAREVYIIEKEIGSLMPDWFVDKGHCMANAVHTPGGRVRTFREVLDDE